VAVLTSQGTRSEVHVLLQNNGCWRRYTNLPKPPRGLFTAFSSVVTLCYVQYESPTPCTDFCLLNCRPANKWTNKTDNVLTNVTWGTFLQTFLQWKSNKYYIFLVLVCSLSYLTWKNACAVLPSVVRWFYHIFSTLSHKKTRFSEKVI